MVAPSSDEIEQETADYKLSVVLTVAATTSPTVRIVIRKSVVKKFF
jgi:hypothetical protein